MCLKEPLFTCSQFLFVGGAAPTNPFNDEKMRLAYSSIKNVFKAKKPYPSMPLDVFVVLIEKLDIMAAECHRQGKWLKCAGLLTTSAFMATLWETAARSIEITLIRPRDFFIEKGVLRGDNPLNVLELLLTGQLASNIKELKCVRSADKANSQSMDESLPMTLDTKVVSYLFIIVVATFVICQFLQLLLELPYTKFQHGMLLLQNIDSSVLHFEPVVD